MFPCFKERFSVWFQPNQSRVHVICVSRESLTWCAYNICLLTLQKIEIFLNVSGKVVLICSSSLEDRCIQFSMAAKVPQTPMKKNGVISNLLVCLYQSNVHKSLPDTYHANPRKLVKWLHTPKLLMERPPRRKSEIQTTLQLYRKLKCSWY